MKTNTRRGEHPKRNILITGGAGFIGSNLAERLLANPLTHVRVFDNLSRSGAEHNVTWLQSLPQSNRLEFVEGDIRNTSSVFDALADRTEIYHLAAQVAVTTSIEEPRYDFEVNTGGTFNILDAALRSGQKPFLLFTSTNKVYGALDGLPVRVQGTRYEADRSDFKGVAESEPLDFHSPYGCSKGAADQYVRDYARIYGLPTVVFRMSCIAGPRQFGTEDQGWVAHFLYSMLERRSITIYGNGFQVRDVLHVHDLVDAIELAWDRSKDCAGEIYNLGGGLKQAISVIEMIQAISRETGVEPILRHSALRPGDQPLYVTDFSKFCSGTTWSPHRGLREILSSILCFWNTNGSLLAGLRTIHHNPVLLTKEVA